MFANSSPLNWHNTLKRLKKDDDFGRSPHSLNHLIVKKRPNTIYIAQATKDLVKSVDKPHRIVPGIKKLVQQSGAKGDSEIIDDASGTSTAEHKPGDLRVEDLEATPGLSASHKTKQTADPAFSTATQDTDLFADLFETAISDGETAPKKASDGETTPKKEKKESATKSATRKLFVSQSGHLPAQQVSAINKQSRIGRAKGHAADTPIKPLPKRPIPARGTNGKWLKREAGAEVGRSNVVKEALESVEKPKRKRAPKSVKKADILAIPLPSEHVPPKKVSAGVGPKPARKLSAKALEALDIASKANAPRLPGQPTHYDEIKRLKLPGVQRLVAQHNVSIPDADKQSPRKIKAHLKAHFGL